MPLITGLVEISPSDISVSELAPYKNANLADFAEMLKISHFYLWCSDRAAGTKNRSRKVNEPSRESPKECSVMICLVELGNVCSPPLTTRY